MSVIVYVLSFCYIVESDWDEDLDDDEKRLPDVLKFLKSLRDIRCTYINHESNAMYQYESLRLAPRMMMHVQLVVNCLVKLV